MSKVPDLKIVVISDTHSLHRSLFIPKCDILVHAGDATNDDFTPRELSDFNRWCGQLKAAGTVKEIVFTPGNHDFCLDPDISTTSAKALASLTNVHCLIDRSITLLGARIYGTPWTRRAMTYCAFPSETEQDSHLKFKPIPSDLDILVSHSPPDGIMDNGFGSRALRDAVSEKQPKYHVFGHVHEGYGQMKTERTTYINGCSIGRRKLAENAPIEFTLGVET